MKKLGLIMTFVALFCTTSCSTLMNNTDTVAAASGATCGRALISLNNSKKAGTLSITNPNDLTNMLAVITAYNGLKANKSNSNYKKSFASGMVTGGSGIITATTATSLTNMLLNSAGLDGVTSSNISQKAQTVTSIIQLLALLNQSN